MKNERCLKSLGSLVLFVSLLEIESKYSILKGVFLLVRHFYKDIQADPNPTFLIVLPFYKL